MLPFWEQIPHCLRIADNPDVGYSETMWDLLPERQHQFRVARNPSRVDATRGDHFLQPTSQDESRHRGRIASGLPTNSEVDPPLRTEGVVIMLWTITYRSSATDVRDNDHPGP